MSALVKSKGEDHRVRKAGEWAGLLIAGSLNCGLVVSTTSSCAMRRAGSERPPPPDGATDSRSLKGQSGLRRQNNVIHKQRVDARLAKRDDGVGGCANDWFAVVERRIDDERHAGFCKETGYEVVKARI